MQLYISGSLFGGSLNVLKLGLSEGGALGALAAGVSLSKILAALGVSPGGKLKNSAETFIKELTQAGKAGAAKNARTQAVHIAQKPHHADLHHRYGVNEVVEIKAGGKGNWDSAINGKLKGNTAYSLDNGHVYITDKSGRVSAVEADLSKVKMDRNTYQQSKVGHSGLPGDDGGHLIASSLGGAGDKINLVPQSQLLNRKEWRDMEKMFDKALADGKNVSIKIDVGYPSGGGSRPNSFVVTGVIDGKEFKEVFKQ